MPMQLSWPRPRRTIRPRGGAPAITTVLMSLCPFLTIGVAPTRGMAQVMRTTPAFQVASLVHQGDTWIYRYRLVGYVPAGALISDVLMEIATPKGPRPPVVYGGAGTMLFDALRGHFAEVALSHPPLWIGSPSHWSAAIYRQGYLSWGASRVANGYNYGVRHGQTVDGYELRSPAVPALRRVYAEPYHSPASPDVEAHGFSLDSAKTVHTAIVVGPGWEAGRVTGEYLREQVTVACTERLVESCGRYLRLTDALEAAEHAVDDRAYARALVALQTYLAHDHVSVDMAHLVIREALRALAARPPAARRPS